MFLKTHDYYPSEHSNDEEEQKIGYDLKKFTSNIRSRLSPKLLAKLKYIFAHIPNFVFSKPFVVFQNRPQAHIRNGKPIKDFVYDKQDKSAAIIVDIFTQL